MSDVTLPVIDYSVKTAMLPQSFLSHENFNFQLPGNVVPYSDYYSSIFNEGNPCDIIRTAPKYRIPTDWKFSKTYIDWVLNKQGSKRRFFNAKNGLDKIVLTYISVRLPFVVDYINPDFWFNNEIRIPTRYVDPNTENWMVLRFKQLILTNYSVSITTDNANIVECQLIGYNPSIEFIDKLPNPKDLFDTWLNKYVEVHTYPDDVNLSSSKDVFNITVNFSTQVRLLTYREASNVEQFHYVYIPQVDGTLERKNGVFNLTGLISSFKDHEWVLVQSSPEMNVEMELYGTLPIQLNNTVIESISICFFEDNTKLGEVRVYSTESTTTDYFRIQLSGIGYFKSD